MDLKKSHKANLERKQGGRFILGFIITLSLILISFEWTTISTKLAEVNAATEITFDMDMMDNIRREEIKPPPKEELPAIAPVPKPVDEDIPMPDINWDPEVSPETEYAFEIFPDPEPEKIDPEKERFIVEIMPTFNGGDPAREFNKYILKSLHYPEVAAQNNVSGKVIVKFVINPEGRLVKAEVIRGVHPDLDNEALRVINSSPKWEPGIQSGHRVSVIYVFPINFVLR
jgi:protein TonB